MHNSTDHQNRIFSILSGCSTLSELSLEEIKTLSHNCLYRVYSSGEKVLTVDHEGRYVFIVGQGKLSLKLKDGTRKEFEEGELFGEIAVISNLGRMGTITCEEDAEIVAIDKSTILKEDQLPIQLRYELMKALASKMITYLYNDIPRSTIDLLDKGECEFVEYKLSLSQPIVIPAIKSIASFMNLNGGTILFGIRDDGTVVGVPEDKTKIDKFQRDIFGKMKSRLGSHKLATLINFDQERIEEKLILRLDVDSSKSPVFYKEIKGQEERELFIVRTGCLNTRIKRTSQIIDYVQNNFKVNY